MADVRAVDLFGGPGGWDVAAQSLGVHVVGLEFDVDACATRRANALPTIRCDVSRYQIPVTRSLDGLIASPPCPQFSNAGLGRGRLLTRELQTAIKDAFAGHERRDLHTNRCADILLPGVLDKFIEMDGIYDDDDVRAVAHQSAAEAMLMVEPARYMVALAPSWVVMEQVPAVLPLFDTYRAQLEALGYWCWVGKLRAEQFGVPQTRTRAVLMASLDHPIHPPTPTHQEYVPGEAAGEGADCRPSLFGPGVLPWISMAEALGVPASFALMDRQDNGAIRRSTMPAPTILASHDNGNKRWKVEGREDTTPLTVEQAAELQSFPCDFKFSGTITSRHRQAGDAMPPLLAWHVLNAVVGDNG